MAVSLGGRAAELIVFGHLSTGAADDLRRVTDIARSMVTRYGMSDKLGNVAYDRDPHTLLTAPIFHRLRMNGIMPRKRQRPLMTRYEPLWRKHSSAPSISSRNGAPYSIARPNVSLKRKRWRKQS